MKKQQSSKKIINILSQTKNNTNGSVIERGFFGDEVSGYSIEY